VYRLPEDLEAELQKKFANAHIPTIVQYIFQGLLEKTLRDGSCSIREFGKFVSFRTRSNRIGQEVIRFKFKMTTTLGNKLKIDQYILDNMPVKATNVFSSEHEEKTKNKKLQQKANITAQKAAEKLGKEKTKSNLVTNEILSIVNNIIDRELEK
jgi:nucleoid DNA-binding protein